MQEIVQGTVLEVRRIDAAANVKAFSVTENDPRFENDAFRPRHEVVLRNHAGDVVPIMIPFEARSSYSGSEGDPVAQITYRSNSSIDALRVGQYVEINGLSARVLQHAQAVNQVATTPREPQRNAEQHIEDFVRAIAEPIADALRNVLPVDGLGQMEIADILAEVRAAVYERVAAMTQAQPVTLSQTAALEREQKPKSALVAWYKTYRDATLVDDATKREVRVPPGEYAVVADMSPDKKTILGGGIILQGNYVDTGAACTPVKRQSAADLARLSEKTGFAFERDFSRAMIADRAVAQAKAQGQAVAR